ncbi:MAG: flagellar biosynthesis protein FlhF [Halioglobus sp.]|nr:flagellar biosynthesis protein FlhF [Halioglobus sp.]
MKIKRYLEKDSRSALARVRAELGPEAVILSNKNVGGQVELVAAIDLDESAFTETDTAPAPAPQPAASRAQPRLQPVPPAHAEPAGFDAGGASLAELQRELGNLRSMIENRLSQMSWRDMAGRPPAKAVLQSRLAQLGLSRTLSGVISDILPAEGDVEEYWEVALQMLASRVPVMREDALIDDGGVVALLGATGVGKTTTIAKLAARFVLRHERDQVALITTDCYRIGGQEQLQTFARYLGIPVMVATDARELRAALDHLMPRRLVLVDTAGMSQRDPRLHEQFSMLKSVGYDVDAYVVLPATAQLRALREVVNLFGEDALAGALVTKVDESADLGGVLDVLIENRLPVAYVSGGQKVPKDLVPAASRALIDQAVALASAEPDVETDVTREGQLFQTAMVRN